MKLIYKVLESKFNLLLILLGSISWILVMFKSGLIYSYGMGFWGANGHDGIWHIALIESLGKGTLQMPVYSGSNIENYHIGFDLIVTFIHKITLIPVVNLYFQIFPIILAILSGIFCYAFVLAWTKSKTQAFWATFFVYFGGSFGWIITYLRSGIISGESVFWSQQSISTLVNPPFALSLVLIFFALYVLEKHTEKSSKKFFITATFILGVLIEVKVYAGILVLAALFVASLFSIIKFRKLDLFKVFSGVLIVSLLVFLPLNKNVNGIVIFKPFWFLETMMGLSDRLNFPKFYDAMVTYRGGGSFLKFIIFYSLALIIFLVGNMGTRIISILNLITKIKNTKAIHWQDIFNYTLIGGGILAPLLFLQKGTPWNTIQFFYYSLTFLGIIAGIEFGKILEKKGKVIVVFLSAVVLVFTLPTTLSTLFLNYLPSRPPAKLSKEELQALNFLSQVPYGIVLTYPFDSNKAEEALNNPPRPLYLYESTAYVSAFSQKPVFLEDEVNLDITGYNWKERRQQEIYFYSSLDHSMVYNFLRQNHISYVYWLKGQRATLGETQLGIKQIFGNSEVNIYQVE